MLVSVGIFFDFKMVLIAFGCFWGGVIKLFGIYFHIIFKYI